VIIRTIDNKKLGLKLVCACLFLVIPDLVIELVRSRVTLKTLSLGKWQVKEMNFFQTMICCSLIVRKFLIKEQHNHYFVKKMLKIKAQLGKLAVQCFFIGIK